MFPKYLLFSVFLLLQFCLLQAQTGAPTTNKVPNTFKEHGGERRDDYGWLSNASDSNVIRHLKAENAYVEASLKHTERLQKKLYDEMVARIPAVDQSLPAKSNGYWYYTRFEKGQQYPFYARKKTNMTAREEMMLDVPSMAKNYKIFLVRGYKVSPDNSLLAYGIDTSGNRKSTLFFKSFSNNKLSAETIANTSGSYAWCTDNKTIYYVLNDPTVRAYKVMRHTVGTDAGADEEIYTERDSTYGVNIRASKNDKYIFITSGSTMTTEVRYLDATNPKAHPIVIQPRQRDLEYYADYHEGNVFHIFTNKDAKNYKLVKAPMANPAVSSWQDVVPHNPKAFLEEVEILKDYYVIQTKEKGLTRIKLYDRKKNEWRSVPFESDAYVANMSMATDDYATDSIRYYFTSLALPGTEYAYNLKTGQKKLLKQQKVGGGFNASLYETKRIWITATDSTQVPISLVYKKESFKKDGTNPMYLYAYGSYGANSDPYFNSSIVSLLDRGAVYAIAHIRGGQELGREWYEGGKVFTKKNTFTDFIDAAQALVAQKYTSSDRLYANGVSAGGMLMGAVANMRPDLFKGIIAEVPWMDVITDMYNTSLPLTTSEYDEWGDPNKKEQYDYMLSWSPLDNIKKASYPAILATGGLNDTQVPYFSPAKWVAKLREYNTGANPVLFKVNMGAGHGGESGRYERQKLQALKYAFVLDGLGWNEASKTYDSKKTF